jgi:hypothetical protein
MMNRDLQRASSRLGESVVPAPAVTRVTQSSAEAPSITARKVDGGRPRRYPTCDRPLHDREHHCEFFYE